MRYMIHAYPGRMWYVEGYLVPKLKSLGIRARDIVVWNDDGGKGNLLSCVEAFAWCGAHKTKSGTWHLQDDVVPCHDFGKRTKEADGVVCGFRADNLKGTRRSRLGAWNAGGTVKPADMWWSFQCIHIPDDLAGECALWFYETSSRDAACAEYLTKRTGDDSFFRAFLMTKHPTMDVTQVSPNLVTHIAELIGGSTVNTGIGFRSASFEDCGEWEEAANWIKQNRG